MSPIRSAPFYWCECDVCGKDQQDEHEVENPPNGMEDEYELLQNEEPEAIKRLQAWIEAGR